jgi:hypothetical protein
VRAPDIGIVGPPFIRRSQINDKGLICQLKIRMAIDGLTLPRNCRIGINDNPKAIIVVLEWPSRWDKKLPQMQGLFKLKAVL